MTDRELLFMAYGAMKATSNGGGSIREVIERIEDYLFPMEESSPESCKDLKEIDDN